MDVQGGRFADTKMAPETRNTIASGDFTVEDDRAVVVQLGQRALESKIRELKDSGPLATFRFYQANRSKMLGKKQSEYELQEFLDTFQFDSLEEAARDQSSMNGLRCAVFSSDSRMIQLLVSRRADVNSRTHGLSKAGYFDGQLLITCAAKSHQPARILRTLVELRADVHARSSQLGSTVVPMARSRAQLQVLMEARADLHSHFVPGGATPLAGACSMANSDTISMMLEARCDPNPAVQGLGQSPLHQAIFFSRGNPTAFTTVKMLLEHGADPNASTSPTGSFSWACRVARAYQALVGKEATPFRIRCFAILPGLSPLGTAAFIGDPDLLQLLLDFGAEAKANSCGDFPEDLARDNGHLHLLPILNTFHV